MKKHIYLWLAPLVVLMLSLTLGVRAFAESDDSGLNDGSDCDCSDSGAGTYGSGASGWSAGHGTSADETDVSVRQEDQMYLAESDGGASLIGINLISLGVVAAIIVMLVRYRKSCKMERDADKNKGSQSGFELPLGVLKKKQPDFCEEDFLKSTERLYVRLQRALSSGNIKPLEDLLGRELYQRLAWQLRSGSTEERTGPIERVKIRNARIVRYESENEEDTLSVRIEASLIKNAAQNAAGTASQERWGGVIFVVSVYKLTRAEGEANWKLTQIRRVSETNDETADNG